MILHFGLNLFAKQLQIANLLQGCIGKLDCRWALLSGCIQLMRFIMLTLQSIVMTEDQMSTHAAVHFHQH